MEPRALPGTSPNRGLMLHGRPAGGGQAPGVLRDAAPRPRRGARPCAPTMCRRRNLQRRHGEQASGQVIAFEGQKACNAAQYPLENKQGAHICLGAAR